MPGTTGLSLHIDTSSVRKALCIAIRYAQLSDKGYELPNVYRDVEHVKEMLVGRLCPIRASPIDYESCTLGSDQYRFREEEITILTDDDNHAEFTKPTRENIVSSCSWASEITLTGGPASCDEELGGRIEGRRFSGMSW